MCIKHYKKDLWIYRDDCRTHICALPHPLFLLMEVENNESQGNEYVEQQCTGFLDHKNRLVSLDNVCKVYEQNLSLFPFHIEEEDSHIEDKS